MHPSTITEATGTIGVRELRRELSGVIARAGNGHTTVVTQRGVAVAEIGPLGRHSADFDQLVATGAVVAPRRAGAWTALPGITIAAGTRLDQAVRDLRG